MDQLRETNCVQEQNNAKTEARSLKIHQFFDLLLGSFWRWEGGHFPSFVRPEFFLGSRGLPIHLNGIIISWCLIQTYGTKWENGKDFEMREWKGWMAHFSEYEHRLLCIYDVTKGGRTPYCIFSYLIPLCAEGLFTNTYTMLQAYQQLSHYKDPTRPCLKMFWSPFSRWP